MTNHIFLYIYVYMVFYSLCGVACFRKSWDNCFCFNIILCVFCVHTFVRMYTQEMFMNYVTDLTFTECYLCDAVFLFQDFHIFSSI